jgi:hypothetical protein
MSHNSQHIQNGQNPQNTDNFDGGNSTASSQFTGEVDGLSNGTVFTPGSTGFVIKYTNIARTLDQIPAIGWTFRMLNQPTLLRFYNSAFCVSEQALNLEQLDLSSFFHPLLSFSNYQSQTFVISPETSVNIDSGSFDDTDNEVSMVVAYAQYLPNTSPEERILFWDYNNEGRYPMGPFMVLTGAVKENAEWKGWKSSSFLTYGHTGPSSPAYGGFVFTNPTGSPVKLQIIMAN